MFLQIYTLKLSAVFKAL